MAVTKGTKKMEKFLDVNTSKLPEATIEISDYSRFSGFEKEIKQKNNIRNPLFECVLSIALTIIIGLVFYVMLAPQQSLSELSRDNSDLKDEIASVQREIIEYEKVINGIMDVDAFKAQALAFGMQEPDANQIVIIPMPSEDKLVTGVAYDAQGVSVDAYNGALANLADYYLERDAR